ncbi:Oxidoreductase [Hirschfeldia incana]|nr:Oxidoreductase [Hirschfeldia incana]
MPPFRFNIPFFSYGSPSRPSSGTSSSSPPPTPPTSSRPPFRPGGIAQPSKPATSLETKPKVSPSLSRAKSNVSATAASASQLPSSGATPARLAKQSNQSGSPVKKPESLRAEEQKVAMKDKPSREVTKEAGESSNPVAEKHLIARSEQKEAKEAQEQRKKREVEKLAVVDRDSKPAQEQQKSKETEKLAVEEKKKGLQKDMEEKTKTAQEQQKSKETDNLAVEEKKKVLGKDMGESSKTTQEQHKRKETEKLAAEEKKKAHSKDMEENSKIAQEQQRRKETEKLAAEEMEKVLRKDTEENSKPAQEQQKSKETEKLAAQERNTTPKTMNQTKTTQHLTAASESTRGPKDLPDRKSQNRTENDTDDNRHKAREGSSSMSRKIKEDIRDGLSKLTWGKSNGDNEKSVSVFTLTGENRGANMAIGSEKDKKDGEVHIRRGYKSNPDESPDTTATETEGGTRPYPKDVEEDARVRAYVNGNSQGVNNSIICDSSVQQNDPGIHVNMKFEKSIKKDETISPPENVVEKKTATEKLLKYEPRVRRRCLRGLLAESSQSDPENPSKPRRHGCRFTCKDKDIENT